MMYETRMVASLRVSTSRFTKRLLDENQKHSLNVVSQFYSSFITVIQLKCGETGYLKICQNNSDLFLSPI
jgi:hypothetical protein